MSEKETGEQENKKKKNIKYTFEDWLNDRLPKPSEDPDPFRRTDEFGSEEHIKSLVNRSLMDQSEANKVFEAKRATFLKSIKLNAELFKKIVHAKSEIANDPEFYISSIYLEIENNFESNPNILKSINANTCDVTNIFAKDYKQLLNVESIDINLIPNNILYSELDWKKVPGVIYYNNFQMQFSLFQFSKRAHKTIGSIDTSNTKESLKIKAETNQQNEANFNIRENPNRNTLEHFESILNHIENSAKGKAAEKVAFVQYFKKTHRKCNTEPRAFAEADRIYRKLYNGKYLYKNFKVYESTRLKKGTKVALSILDEINLEPNN